MCIAPVCRIGRCFRLAMLSIFLLPMGLINPVYAGLSVSWSTKPEAQIILGDTTKGVVSTNYYPDFSYDQVEEYYTGNLSYYYLWTAVTDGTCSPSSGSSSTSTISFTSKGDKTVTVTVTVSGYYTITNRNTGSTRTVYINESKSLSASVRVMELTLEVRRTGTTSWGSSADIAAGGKASNIHKADVQIKLDPTPSISISVSISVNGTAADGGGSGTRNVKSSLSGLGLSDAISGVNQATASLSSYSTSGTFTSSNKLGEIKIKAKGKEVTIMQKWADNPDWDYESVFTPGEDNPVSLTDISLNGEALDEHVIWFYAMQVELDSLYFDFDEYEFYWDQRTVVRKEDEPLTRYTKFTPDASLKPNSGIGQATVSSISIGAGTKVTVQHFVEGVIWSTEDEWDEESLWASIVNSVTFKAADSDVWEK